MNIYIFEYLDMVSNAYHCQGGMAIVADSWKRARELYELHLHALVEAEYSTLRESEIGTELEYFDNADHTSYSLSLKETRERVFVFPDTGCC